LTVLLALLFSMPALADEEGPALSPSHKAKIFMAGLSLSRGLPAVKDNVVKVLLAGDCETADALSTFVDKKLNGATVEFKRIGAGEVLKSMGEQLPAIVFLCPEANKKIPDVVAAAEKYKVVTISDDAAGVDNGLMFGVEVRGARAGLVLNLPQAKSIGLEFDPRFYVVARVIK
jgi:hypothetical protein